MRKAYIVAAKRSAIGTFLGSLTDVDLATVGATVLKETIKLMPEEVQADPG